MCCTDVKKDPTARGQPEVIHIVFAVSNQTPLQHPGQHNCSKLYSNNIKNVIIFITIGKLIVLVLEMNFNLQELR